LIYLLDSNAWITLMRKKSTVLSQKVHAASPTDIVLCSVVLGELLYGVHRSDPSKQPTNMALVQHLRQQFQSLPFDDRAAEEYGIVRADLSARGLMIGPNDVLIASIALANNATLVSHNTAEFSRINRLLLEDWQTP
jgi:tRNA(fMet)-specific endonuclease VapC